MNNPGTTNSMKPFKPFKKFQIRWKEPLGLPEYPYLYRWMIIFFGYSIRLHHWLRSDDNRHFHDHSCDLISTIIKGYYYNVTPRDPDKPNVRNCHTKRARAFKPWKAKATDKHYLRIPKAGAWTILLQGRPYHKWGFYVNNHKWRPLRYFHKFGIIQDKNYRG
jgi:hypothetical protein